MITQEFTAPVSGSPVLLLGPVDADYTVVVTYDAIVQLGDASMTSASVGGGGCRFGQTVSGISGGRVTLQLKVGDSLYALGVPSAVNVGIFAQPC